MNEILVRIKKLITQLGLNETSYAKNLNFPQPTISNMFNRNSYPKSELLLSIVKKWNVSAEWIITGEG